MVSNISELESLNIVMMDNHVFMRWILVCSFGCLVYKRQPC